MKDNLGASPRCKFKQQRDFIDAQLFIHRMQAVQIMQALSVAEELICAGRADIAASMCYETIQSRGAYGVQAFGKGEY